MPGDGLTPRIIRAAALTRGRPVRRGGRMTITNYRYAPFTTSSRHQAYSESYISN